MNIQRQQVNQQIGFALFFFSIEEKRSDMHVICYPYFFIKYFKLNWAFYLSISSKRLDMEIFTGDRKNASSKEKLECSRGASSTTRSSSNPSSDCRYESDYDESRWFGRETDKLDK